MQRPGPTLREKKDDSVPRLPITKTTLLALLLSLSMVMSACSLAPETVGEMAKTSIQEVFRADPRFKDIAIEVVSVQASAAGERRYQGTASIRYAGKMHEVPVEILIDGLSIKWTTAPDAFSFVPQIKPPQ